MSNSQSSDRKPHRRKQTRDQRSNPTARQTAKQVARSEESSNAESMPAQTTARTNGKPSKRTARENQAASTNTEHPAYIHSDSFTQAFRNLSKLNVGAAWRASHWPLIVLLLAFALVALSVVDAFPIVDSFNEGVNAAIHSLRGESDGIIVALTTIGDIFPMLCICALICGFLYLLNKWDSMVFFAINVVGAVVVAQLLKLVFAVPRPSAATLVNLPPTYSFPSAHSLCTLVVCGMLGLLIYRAFIRKGASTKVALIPGILLVILALAVGLSRIYVGVHWPSDVLGGWLLGAAWLVFAGALYTAGSRITQR